jgi:DNA polymerase-3 subunit epsilon
MNTMRQIVLDTETTGIDTRDGHRLVEIGCIELLHRRATGRHYHTYLNPEREVDEGAQRVHGLSRTMLADKPRFAEVAAALLEFLGEDELIIHNAPFDLGFLDYEFALLDPAAPLRLGERCSVLDTLPLARKLHPGQKNSLDALCKRYNVDNSNRELHGALLDARLLADVYLAMTGGQNTLQLDAGPRAAPGGEAGAAAAAAALAAQLTLTVQVASAAEREAHDKLVELVHKQSGGKSVWRQLEKGS